MRTDLEHMTVAKRQELARVVSILFDEFSQALAGRNAPHAKSVRILKILLFGSYARADWVVGPHAVIQSDGAAPQLRSLVHARRAHAE